jgi:hypothetical protein
MSLSRAVATVAFYSHPTTTPPPEKSSSNLNRGYHSRCTWTAPTEIEFRCRTMIGVSAYLKIDNKKKIKIFFSRKKKVFYRHQKMSLFQLLNFKWLYFFRFYSCAQNFLNSYIWLPDGLSGLTKKMTFFLVVHGPSRKNVKNTKPLFVALYHNDI